MGLSSTGIFENNEILRLLAIAVAMVLFLALLSGPFVLIFTLYLNGFQILKREGVHLHNFLSMGLGTCPDFLSLHRSLCCSIPFRHQLFLNMVFIYVGFLVSYAIIISMLYTTSSFINLVNLFPGKLDYVVVLGTGLIGDKVTPLLASRIEKRHSNLPETSWQRSLSCQADRVLMNSWQKDRPWLNHAFEQGTPVEDIVIENQSTNTEENLKFSYALMKPGSRFALVTNYYHVSELCY